MRDISIHEATAKILTDYMELTGNMCSPSITDYLAIREVAFKELKSGILFSEQETIPTIRKNEHFADNNPTLSDDTKQKTQAVRNTTQGTAIPNTNTSTVRTSKPTVNTNASNMAVQNTANASNTTGKKEPATTHQKEKPKSDFEILRALKDEWN